MKIILFLWVALLINANCLAVVNDNSVYELRGTWCIDSVLEGTNMIAYQKKSLIEHVPRNHSLQYTIEGKSAKVGLGTGGRYINFYQSTDTISIEGKYLHCSSYVYKSNKLYLKNRSGLLVFVLKRISAANEMYNRSAMMIDSIHHPTLTLNTSLQYITVSFNPRAECIWINLNRTSINNKYNQTISLHFPIDYGESDFRFDQPTMSLNNDSALVHFDDKNVMEEKKNPKYTLLLPQQEIDIIELICKANRYAIQNQKIELYHDQQFLMRFANQK
jgi:hypothetical protein